MKRLALAFLASCATTRAPAAPSNQPSTWLDGPVNAALTIDLAAARADPTYEKLFKCAATAKHKRLPGVEGMPCRAELLGAERIDMWSQLEADEPESTLLVVRGAEGARACIEAETPGKPIGAELTEHVRFGKLWPRVFVVGKGDDTTMLFPVGPAIVATRSALVAKRALPPAYRLPSRVVAHARVTLDLLVALVLPESTFEWDFGLVDIAVNATAEESVGLDMRFDLATKRSADAVADVIKAASLPKRGVDVKMDRPIKTQLSATFSAPSSVVAAVCE